MNQTKPSQSVEGSRRKILKAMAASSGAILAGKSLPDTWTSPVVDSVILPAHAQTSPTLFAIGDTGPGGGIVFYISNGGLNGMEAAPSDQDGGGGAPWGCPGVLIGTGIAFGDGAANTTAILAGCADPGTAAELASNYAGGGFSDWFLPSTTELTVMHTQLYLNGLGGFGVFSYWSSTEIDASEANAFLFPSGGGGFGVPKNITGSVRAARSF